MMSARFSDCPHWATDLYYFIRFTHPPLYHLVFGASWITLFLYELGLWYNQLPKQQPAEVQLHHWGCHRGGEEARAARQARPAGPHGERGGRSQQVLRKKRSRVTGWPDNVRDAPRKTSGCPNKLGQRFHERLFSSLNLYTFLYPRLIVQQSTESLNKACSGFGEYALDG